MMVTNYIAAFNFTEVGTVIAGVVTVVILVYFAATKAAKDSADLWKQNAEAEKARREEVERECVELRAVIQERDKRINQLEAMTDLSKVVDQQKRLSEREIEAINNLAELMNSHHGKLDEILEHNGKTMKDTADTVSRLATDLNNNMKAIVSALRGDGDSGKDDHLGYQG